MADNDFQRDEDPFHVSWNRAGLLDDLDLANKTTVGCVHLDEVGLANARFFDELEPVSSGAVEGLPLRGINDGMIWSNTEI